MARNCMGWRPDKPDQRDFHFAARYQTEALPAMVDLRPNCPPIWDQGNLGSCTAQAIAAALQFDAIKNNQWDKKIVRSRLFIYYNERVMENSVNDDAGAEIRDGIKSVATLGACNESLWWYNTNKFTVKPSKKCYDNGMKYKALTYMRVPQTLSDMKSCLHEGFPIVLGISVYSSFMSDEVANGGRVPMPQMNEALEGGHAILIVGYNDGDSTFIARNSWSTMWGDNGYFYIPQSYLTNGNLCDDLWTIRTVL